MSNVDNKIMYNVFKMKDKSRYISDEVIVYFSYKVILTLTEFESQALKMSLK